MPLSTDNSVALDEQHGTDKDEGEALEALDPGMGVERGAGGFGTPVADSTTKRVVREQRNPGSRGIEDGTSPLDEPYTTGDNVETIGFRSHQEARLRVEADAAANETISEGDKLGWNASGYLTPNATTYVATAINETDITITDTENEFVPVEFL